MTICLFRHQKLALSALKSGSILCGGVGSGKSITALAYYYTKECGGMLDVDGRGGSAPMIHPKDLYIITTARKRDTLEWEKELAPFLLTRGDRSASISDVLVTVDSWNNISKYVDVENAFFIFDEQRVVGSGAWVKAFLKITKVNCWLLLTATPGDTWSDYIPAFVANGFYKNRTEFIRRHVVYNNFMKFPKVDHYVECSVLVRLKQKITVYMEYERVTKRHSIDVSVPFDKDRFQTVTKNRWNPFTDKPIRDVGALCYTLRKVVNSDTRRLDAVKKIALKHGRVIVFYNFNYELEMLRGLRKSLGVPLSEYNGHKHEEIPKTENWIYLVQYTSGAEGWNCTDTDTIIFFSQNYSYKIMIQAAGRIDRLNTPFTDLYYYHLRSSSSIDLAIFRALRNKKAFNENNFAKI